MAKKTKKDGKQKKKDKAKQTEPEVQVVPVAEATAQRSTERKPKLPRDEYEDMMEDLQIQLVALQDWVVATGERIIIIFEGRDAAGKGGIIRRITERVSPRVFRTVALPAPTEREKSQWYLQRYINHFPAAGEIVIFDRSWYNRLGVEHVMGFCSQEQYEDFLTLCAPFERELVSSGIRLIKYWINVNQEEQERRFKARINDPMRQWKLSPMDVESFRRWWDYSAAIDAMFSATDTDYAPWYVVPSDDKRRARLNCIKHLLNIVPYEEIAYEKPTLPKRQRKPRNLSHQRLFNHYVPDYF